MPKSPISGLHQQVAPYLVPSQTTLGYVEQTWKNLHLILRDFYFPHHADSTQGRKTFGAFLKDLPTQLAQDVDASLNGLRSAKQRFIDYRGKMTQESQDDLSLESPRASNVTIKNAEYVQMAYDLRSQHPDKNLMMLNMANAVRMGGVAFYGKGTAEEKLCRHSDLLLSMILDHITDSNLQKKWLTFVCKTLESYESTGQFPFRTRAGYQKYIKELLALIYEAEGNAYNIDPLDPHIHPNVLLLDPSFNFSDPAQKAQFHQRCVTIQVADLAAVDLRWLFGERRSVSRTFGLTIDLPLYKANMMGRIEAMMEAAIDHQAKILNLSALGCGAFGGDPSVVAECFAEVFNSRAKLLAGTEIHFGVFADNFTPFLNGLRKTLNPKQFKLFNDKDSVTITPTLYAPVEQEAYDIGVAAAQGWMPYLKGCLSIRAMEHPNAYQDGYNQATVKKLRA